MNASMVRCAGLWLAMVLPAPCLAAAASPLKSAAERWPLYRESVRKTPGLVRLYTFEDVQDAASVVKDLMGSTDALRFVP